MNKVYIMGHVASQPRLMNDEGSPAHLSFALKVTHRARSGGKKEYYPVNAWNQTAQWGLQQLCQGQRVLVEGYLTQRVKPEGFVQIQITANRFYPQDGTPAQEEEQQPEETQGQAS